ncbi:hypothetical protein DFH06DRAFT_161804 [Mycena polygramma]|nr:hypothetical protein DFH06DRAFT_161804 [Mycena polygramma]
MHEYMARATLASIWIWDWGSSYFSDIRSASISTWLAPGALYACSACSIRQNRGAALLTTVLRLSIFVAIGLHPPSYIHFSGRLTSRPTFQSLSVWPCLRLVLALAVPFFPRHVLTKWVPRLDPCVSLCSDSHLPTVHSTTSYLLGNSSDPACASEVASFSADAPLYIQIAMLLNRECQSAFSCFDSTSSLFVHPFSLLRPRLGSSRPTRSRGVVASMGYGAMAVFIGNMEG